ncbi:chemotaxis protein CheB [Sphingobacterium oryzagri]|uniref:Chemotaxis protein CheB n=1 Tax=Sphingobacterium oryzagri TaxID=3025669 RepID=A0ABY7WQK4_9SPHI|nr:chemotaxis protein CheB [Sphingobacterium sp. KACC 22765]WDF70723.1 chemotaxis protein CheB [Sphingobacterium sp. KACC 22765]
MANKQYPAPKYVVGVGASAGGLEAIHDLFDRIPAEIDAAFVLIQHLSSDHKSLLVELVSKHTHMKVLEATENQQVERSCVYVIPNDKLITIRNGRLRLSLKGEKVPNNAIDNFFVSLAKNSGSQAIAIVLSGTGSDGTLGIEAIKEHGGMVIAQDPQTARFDSMPVNAIKSGNVDYAVPVSMMYEKLADYISLAPVRALENGEVEEKVVNEVFELVHQRTDHDFSLYKTPTIYRRIGRRMKALNIGTVDAYLETLKNSEQEVETLGKEFLIGVTRFFRDQAAFKILETKVIPAIIDSKIDKDVVKIWVCACSTGEEVYSVAILVDRYVKQAGKELDIKIFASDIDEASLEIASRNSYPESFKKDIPEDLFNEYFIQDGQSISVVPHIRKQVVFAKHNVIKTPPFIKNDLICCRNMLIYMNSLLQQNILNTFHFSLNPNGFLFLGPSETVNPIKDGVKEINSKWKIFQKTGNIPRTTEFVGTERSGIKRQFPITLPKKPKKTSEELFQQYVVEQYGLVGVFIDKNFEIKDTVGNYKRFLSLPDKRLEVNLLKMVPKEISYLLNNTIRAVWKENISKSLKRLKIKHGADDIVVNIEVSPANADLEKPFTLIVFRQVDTDLDAISAAPPIATDEHQTSYLFELESELSEVRSNLQIAIEEMDTTNEELQSSNEELLSANEELQSSNEELQSLNEELHTLNAEHQQKIKELIELNDDLNNYFKSADIAQIFVDASGRIRKFNPAAVDMVNLIEADIGRPINHISNNIHYDHFLKDIDESLKTANAIPEREIELKNGRLCLLRILPYVRIDGQIDGVIITFVDITTLSELSNIIVGVFKTSLSAVLVFTPVRNARREIVDFKCFTANNTAESIAEVQHGNMVNLLLRKQLPALYSDKLFEQLKDIVGTEENLQTEILLDNQQWYIVTATNIGDFVAVTYTDVSERKKSEQSLKKNYNELVNVRESLKTLNTELETRVRERTLSLTKSEDRFNLVSQATNDTIWDWDLVNNTIWRSQNFTSMFGYESTEETQTTSFWYEKIHPDDIKRVRNSVFTAINEQKEVWQAEYRFAKMDGDYAEILDRGSIQHDKNGVAYRMVGSVVDVTDIKQAERRKQELQDFILRQQKEFYELFAHVPALISIRRGKALTYEYTNAAFKDFYADFDLIGVATADAHEKRVDRALYKADEEILRSGIATSGKAFKVQKYDSHGKEIGYAWLDYLFTPIFDDREQIDGIAFFGFEVTELVKAQLSTRQLMNRKDEFMSIASHELKTPITSLKGMLQIGLKSISQGRPTPMIGDFLAKSLKQTDKLTFLVNDLLDVTKIHAGKMQLNYTEFNLYELLTDVIFNFENEDTSHRIELRSATSLPISADRHRIEQVITNFLSNAIKYSPGQQDVIVDVESIDDNHVRIAVTDFGIGISPDKKDMVFDRFFRVEESIKFSGLGLGLFICKDIIERHAGKVGVESEEGVGSTFWFSLPTERTS